MKPGHLHRRLAAIALAAALGLFALCACGQKGALYLPDRTPKVIVPANAAPTPADTKPADTKPADATTSPADSGATTRKAPRDPDPATAR